MKSAAIASLMLFFSELAALIYQSLGGKQLALVVGGKVYAVTIGMSVFFAGLALGNWGIGRWVDRAPNPVGIYSTPAWGIALTGVGSTWALAQSDRLLVERQETVGWLALAVAVVACGGAWPC